MSAPPIGMIISPPSATGGTWAERLLADVVCVVLDLSTTGTVDGAPTVVQVLFYGILATIARRAKCTALEAATQLVPRGLREPVMVAALPSGWQTRRAAAPTEEARVWAFEFRASDGLVDVWFTQALTLEAALDHIYTHMQRA